jgi:hypothetical protein
MEDEDGGDEREEKKEKEKGCQLIVLNCVECFYCCVKQNTYFCVVSSHIVPNPHMVLG